MNRSPEFRAQKKAAPAIKADTTSLSLLQRSRASPELVSWPPRRGHGN
jgi:hypothetical protein